MKVVGTCDQCGGPVTVPTVWMGLLPPVPQCASCSARLKQPHGPVLPMEKGVERDIGNPLDFPYRARRYAP